MVIFVFHIVGQGGSAATLVVSPTDFWGFWLVSHFGACGDLVPLIALCILIVLVL